MGRPKNVVPLPQARRAFRHINADVPFRRHLEHVAEVHEAESRIARHECPNGCGPLRLRGCPKCHWQLKVADPLDLEDRVGFHRRPT